MNVVNHNQAKMALDVKISYSWTNYCRLCLMNEGIMLPLFDEEGVRRQLGRKIEECFQMLTYDGDPLPRRICHKCLYKLNQAYEFRTMALESFERLKVHLLPLKHVEPVHEYLEKSEELRGLRNMDRKIPSSLGTLTSPLQEPYKTTPTADVTLKTSSINLPARTMPRIRIKSEAELRAAQPCPQVSPFLQNLVPKPPLPQLQSTRIGEQSFAASSAFHSPQKTSLPQYQSTRITSPQRNSTNASNPLSLQNLLSSATANWPLQTKSPPLQGPHIASQSVEQLDPKKLVNLRTSIDEHDETLKRRRIWQGSDCDLGTSPSTNAVSALPKKKRRKQLVGPASRKAVAHPTGWQCLLCSNYFLSRKSLSLHMDECLKCKTCSKEFSSLDEKAVHEADKHLLVLVDAEKKHMPKRCSRCSDRFASSVMLAMHVKYDHSTSQETYNHTASNNHQLDGPESKGVKSVADISGNAFSDVPTKSASELSSEESDINSVVGGSVCDIPEKLSATEMSDPSLSVKGDSFHCMKCDRKFTTKTSMHHHLQFHDKLSFKCSDCSNVFPSGSKLRIHEIKEHGKRKPSCFRCMVCNEIFQSRSLLINHKQTHKSKGINDGINENLSLPKKIVTENKGKVMSCHRCSEEFYDDDAFMWHLYQHAGATENDKAKVNNTTVNERNCIPVSKVSVGGEKGQSSSDLIESSNEEKAIKCERCNVICRSKEYYTLHMARHLGKTKCHFPCIGCDQVFRNIEALNRHTCFGKEAKEKESCLDCGQALKASEDHACDNKCRLCGKVFRSARGQRLHGVYKHGIGLITDLDDDDGVPAEEEIMKFKEQSFDVVGLVQHDEQKTVAGGLNSGNSSTCDKQYQSGKRITDRCSLERRPPDGAPCDQVPVPVMSAPRDQITTPMTSRPAILIQNSSYQPQIMHRIVLNSTSAAQGTGTILRQTLASSNSIPNTSSSSLQPPSVKP